MVTNGSKHHKCLDCEKLVYYSSLRCNSCANKISKFLRFKEVLKPIIINEETEQVLLGSLLGDAHLHKSSDYENSNAYFTESHSIKQSDYLLWKTRYLDCFKLKTQYYSR